MRGFSVGDLASASRSSGNACSSSFSAWLGPSASIQSRPRSLRALVDALLRVAR